MKTVKQYAAAAEVSQQAVYKKIRNGKLKTVKQNGTLYILDDSEVESEGLNHSTAPLNHSTDNLNRLNHEQDGFNRELNPDSTGEVEKVEYPLNHSTGDFKPLNPSLNPDSTATAEQQLIKTLQEQLAKAETELQRQRLLIEQKDETIANLAGQLATIAATATENAARQQYLLAAAAAKAGEQAAQETESAAAEPEIDADRQQQEHEKPKKGFWKWLFGLE